MNILIPVKKKKETCDQLSGETADVRKLKKLSKEQH